MNTKIIITPFGKVEIILKEWITGKEKKQIEKPFRRLKMTVDSAGVGKGEMDAGTASEESIKIAIETVVVSVGGKTENVYDQIGAMRQCDYKFILDEVDKVVKDEDFTNAGSMPAAGIGSAN